jgi:hypothetical protein
MELLHYGALGGLPPVAITAVATVALLGAIHLGAPMWLWTTLLGLGCWTFGAPWWLATLLLLPCVVLTLPPLRRGLLGNRVLGLLRSSGFLPSISDTERAGDRGRHRVARRRTVLRSPVAARPRWRPTTRT